MADHIPFVYNEKDCTVLRKVYSDSIAVRLSLETYSKIASHLPNGPIRWLDPAVDGLERWPKWDTVPDKYRTHVEGFEGYDRIGDSSFQSKPQSEVATTFVDSVLDRCIKLNKTGWISVPQLPQTNDASRNKINRELARSTQKWRSSRNFQGRLILPVIFTHQNQINLKTQRNKRIDLIRDCYQLSAADGIWVAESSLADQEGSHTFERVRFPGLLALHQELSEILPTGAISIGGPYWGMNLILWARGLVRYPAIGLGNSYQYHVPGGMMKPGKIRVALPPLKRWAVASVQLESWLKHAIRRLPKEDTAFSQLNEILRNFAHLSIDSRLQVATFYKEWFDKISAVSPSGRALALYQDLSSAFVIGKKLPDLPKDEGTARKPWQVAKQLMVNCL
jgi:hypothetical protein